MAHAPDGTPNPASRPEHRPHARSVRLAIVVALVGAMATGLVAWGVWSRAQHQAETALANDVDVLAEATQRSVATAVDRLKAVGGLHQASGEVTRLEFLRFADVFELDAGMGGVGYVPLVPAADLDAFVAMMRDSIDGYAVFELDPAGRRVPVGDRPVYAPVQWFEPADAFGRPHGFDAMSEPQRRSAVEWALAGRDVGATSFLRLVSDDDTDGFLLYWPVVSPETREVEGVAVAPMDLSDLITGNAPPSVLQDIEWSIVDVTGTPKAGSAASAASTRILPVGGRRWMLTVTPGGSTASRADQAGSLLVLVAGLSASLLAGLGVHLYGGRSRARRELDRVKELARVKDQFLASVSHELRTPLTGVLGFSELLRDEHDDLDRRERRALIANMARDASDMAHIIDDLLVAARSELDLLTVTRVPVSAQAQVAQVLEVADEALARRVRMTAAGVGCVMLADPARVRQILRNLLQNADRYGGDVVEVRCARRDGMVHVEVRDDGPGIPSDEWERVFEAYHRVHHADGQPGALGIGLSVARHLARLMGGDLTYRFEDGWSLFDLALPAAQSPWTGAVRDVAVGAAGRSPAVGGA